MSMRRLRSTIFGVALLPALELCASAQISEAAARQQAEDVVRSTLNLRREQFLNILRDEALEQSLAVSAGGRTGQELIYRLSSTGYEIKEKAIVHHFSTEGEFVHIVVVRPSDRSSYRIRGFADSLAEFKRLVMVLKMKVLGPDQAEAVADFYREVNPENRLIAPLSSMFDLKQGAERQCQTIPFDTGERLFEGWWKKARRLYADVPFGETAAAQGGGYLVEWIVLSSAGSGACAGVPLRAQLEVGTDGTIGKLTFVPLRQDHR